MFFFPGSQQVWTFRKAAHDAIDVILGDRLKNNAPKLVFEKLYLDSGMDTISTPEFGGDHKLSF